MQKVRSHPCGLLLFVCMRFQDLFHSPPGVLFAFPSQYWFTIGRSRVFSLTGWSPLIPTRFLVSRGTLDPALLLSVSPTGLSPSLAGLSRTVPLQSEVINAVRTPECTHSGLGSFHFARRYFENRVFFLFLRLLRCFSSLR